MRNLNLREIIALVVLTVAVCALVPCMAWASSPCAEKHPLSPPDKAHMGQCPNCGMARPMWARTWKTFDVLEGATQACSFHCLADMSLKSGRDPLKVQVALFTDYARMISAEQAYFVVGSSIPGTMTMISKAAFADDAKAKAFAASCGGTVERYAATLAKAKSSVIKENQMIVKRRISKGKIVEPQMDVVCSECGMKPAKYPQHKSQIQGKDGKVAHFCSTHCMFKYMRGEEQDAKEKVNPFLIWVMGMDSNSWISGRTAYYVVGSKVKGPMGPEALPFNMQSEASRFAKSHGGTAVIFDGVSLEKMMAK